MNASVMSPNFQREGLPKNSYYIDPLPESKTKIIFKKIGKVFFNGLQVLVFLGVLLVLVYLFIFPINVVRGVSMTPNFCDGDIYVTYKLGHLLNDKPYNHGDVIAFRFSDGNHFIKRVIGVPGDQISIFQGKVYRNGSPIEESYLHQGVSTNLEHPEVLSEGQMIVIPSRKYFVLGDNRSASYDSRGFGLVDIDTNHVNGKVVLVLWPAERMRVFNPFESLPQNACEN